MFVCMPILWGKRSWECRRPEKFFLSFPLLLYQWWTFLSYLHIRGEAFWIYMTCSRNYQLTNEMTLERIEETLCGCCGGEKQREYKRINIQLLLLTFFHLAESIFLKFATPLINCGISALNYYFYHLNFSRLYLLIAFRWRILFSSRYSTSALFIPANILFLCHALQKRV